MANMNRAIWGLHIATVEVNDIRALFHKAWLHCRDNRTLLREYINSLAIKVDDKHLKETIEEEISFFGNNLV